MNEETIRKILSGEVDIAKMDRDDFIEMLKCLGRMYFSRVMNCVDRTGKSDKEWTALSSIFRRAVEIIFEKPRCNAAKLCDAVEYVAKLDNGYSDYEVQVAIEKAINALAAPARNCDVGTAREQERRHKEEVCPKSACPKHEGFVSNACKGCFAMWAQMPYREGGAK